MADSVTIAPKYLRARIEGLHNLRRQLTAQLQNVDAKTAKELEIYIAQLRSGVYPDDVDPDGIELMVMKDQEFSNEPLSFTEKITFNTWFELYPHKICGDQITTGSRDFPVSVKGGREDVERAIDATLESITDLDSLEYLALETELKLFKL